MMMLNSKPMVLIVDDEMEVLGEVAQTLGRGQL